MQDALNPEEKQLVYQNIVDGSEPRLSFYILVVLSTVIAAYGLIANSTAVVIGAMIVAPLMTPIVGIALSLVSGDSHLFKRAMLAEIGGVLCSITLGYLSGSITLGVELSSEILARTQPLPYDILVALAAGLAGAYSLVNSRINAALAGVAIAVSLVPPLATTGICLALNRHDLAIGSFLLFFANFLAIQLASVGVFIISGFIDYYHYKETELLIKKETDKLKLALVFAKRFLPSILLLSVVTWHLSQTLIKSVNEKQFKRQLENIIKEEIQERTGAKLANVNYKKEKDGKINAIAVIMTPQEFTPSDIAKIQQHTEQQLGKNINIIMRSIISKDADMNGTIYLLDEEKLKRQKQSEEKSFLTQINELLNQSLNKILGAHLVEVKREDNADIKTIIAIVRTPIAIKPSQVDEMQSSLQTLDKNIRLIVRSVLTRDADATHYLYQATEETITEALNSEELALRKTLETALKKAIKDYALSSVLLDFQYTVQNDGLNLLAVIQTPQNFSREQVAKIEQQLKATEPRVAKLIVRSVVGVDMDAQGFVNEEQTPAMVPDGSMKQQAPAVQHK
jgi:uncharacterized hydrophobic protein (TIGR00271 family)